MAAACAKLSSRILSIASLQARRLPVSCAQSYKKQCVLRTAASRLYCTEENTQKPEEESLEMEEEHAEPLLVPKPVKPEETFEEMLRNSALVKMGRPQGKIVQGKIFYINGNDMYVDFGWKLHGVVKMPEYGDYKEGSEVKVKINELEQTGHFLGQHRRLTICEADIKLVEDMRLEQMPAEKEEKEKEKEESLMDILLG